MPPSRAIQQRMLCGGIYISQRAFTAFLFWVGEILQDFVTPKQALINAFILCLFPSAYDAQTSLGAGLRCKCTTIFRSRQRSMNIFAKYILFSKFNISVQSLNLFKICDSQRFASCVVLHVKNRVGMRES